MKSVASPKYSLLHIYLGGVSLWQWVGTLHSEITAVKPRLAHRCSPDIGSTAWPKFCPLWSNHWKLEMCAGSCAVQMSWGGAGSLPAEVRRGWRLEAEALSEWVSGWVGVFLFSNKSTQNNQRFPVTTVPASLALLSKMYFSSHLHTYPSLYLNYQHLNFCGWLQPEFGSFRWE